jgi:transposase
LDASIIKAWSTRYPFNSQKGYSDSDARVGRAGRMFALGYKLHLSIDAKSMLPLANVFASANQNEKKHSLTLVEKTRRILSNVKAKIRSVIADSQYSDRKLREAVAQTVIPYPSNQKRGVKGILRVDKKFRTYGPDELRKEYHKRPSVEAVYSFLKTQYSMATNKVRLNKCCLLHSLQHTLLNLKQGSSSKYWKSGQSSFTHLLQHLISGQGSALKCEG